MGLQIMKYMQGCTQIIDLSLAIKFISVLLHISVKSNNYDDHPVVTPFNNIGDLCFKDYHTLIGYIFLHGTIIIRSLII